MVTEERADEVRHFLPTLREWAEGRLDVVLLTEDQKFYLERRMAARVGGVELVNMRQWGTLTERRFAPASRLEVELGVASPSWSSTNPVDEGTCHVVMDGVAVVYDPEGLLAQLVDTCGCPRVS